MLARTRTWLVLGAVLATALLASLAAAGWYLSARLEPFVRERLVAFLSSRFDCDVVLEDLDVSMPRGNTIDTGQVQFFFVNFPIAELHPQAFKAHEAAAWAGEQGKYWDMHDQIFSNQRRLAPADLVQHAAAIGLDMAKFQPCLGTGRTADFVRGDLARAQQLGFNGTPTFLVGTIEPNGTTVKGLKVITGAQPFAVFKQTLDEMLTVKK